MLELNRLKLENSNEQKYILKKKKKKKNKSKIKDLNWILVKVPYF